MTLIAITLFALLFVVTPIIVLFSSFYGLSKEHRQMIKEEKMNKLPLKEIINKALEKPPVGCYWEIKYENDKKDSFSVTLITLAGEKYSSIGINLIDCADKSYYFRQVKSRSTACLNKYKQEHMIQSPDIEGVYGL